MNTTLCLNCHKEIATDAVNAIDPRFCQAACLRQFGSLSLEDKAIFRADWMRELRRKRFRESQLDLFD